MFNINIPVFRSNNELVNAAFRIAVSDFIANIYPYKDGLLEKEELCIIAGSDYTTPWTRDAAINTWNSGGLIASEVAKNTLLAVLEKDNGKTKIAGQYWDAIIWTIGAWWEYLYTGDVEFLQLSLETTKNSLDFFEKTEFDDNLNLFSGPACYGDGVSAYPDAYVGGNGGILDFVNYHKDKLKSNGVGIPMFALSTNCLYYMAYKLVKIMSDELKLDCDKSFENKALNIKNAINKYFWLEDKGTYRYLIDDYGTCDFQEGIGVSFAILFGVADNDQINKILSSVYIAPQGIPCVWPSFSRYLKADQTGFGRHSGTIWPHIEAFFADAACKNGRVDLFEKELNLLSARAFRDGNFAEIYHPFSGQIYGGRQEMFEVGILEGRAVLKQTWSATGYLRLILFDLIGMRFTNKGIEFNPTLVMDINEIFLDNIVYRGSVLSIHVVGSGNVVDKIYVNDKEHYGYFMPCNNIKYNIKVVMKSY